MNKPAVLTLQLQKLSARGSHLELTASVHSRDGEMDVCLWASGGAAESNLCPVALLQTSLNENSTIKITFWDEFPVALFFLVRRCILIPTDFKHACSSGFR